MRKFSGWVVRFGHCCASTVKEKLTATEQLLATEGVGELCSLSDRQRDRRAHREGDTWPTVRQAPCTYKRRTGKTETLTETERWRSRQEDMHGTGTHTDTQINRDTTPGAYKHRPKHRTRDRQNEISDRQTDKQDYQTLKKNKRDDTEIRLKDRWQNPIEKQIGRQIKELGVALRDTKHRHLNDSVIIILSLDKGSRHYVVHPDMLSCATRM